MLFGENLSYVNFVVLLYIPFAISYVLALKFFKTKCLTFQKWVQLCFTV